MSFEPGSTKMKQKKQSDRLIRYTTAPVFETTELNNVEVKYMLPFFM